MRNSSDYAALSGAALVLALDARYPGHDWIAALGKAMIRPRHDIQEMLAAETAPIDLIRALASLPEALELGDPEATDDIFCARTNDGSAMMEVDGESGMVVSPGNKGMPSQSGSDHEMGTQTPKTEKNGEFLPILGVAEWIAPLHATKAEPDE